MTEPEDDMVSEGGKVPPPGIPAPAIPVECAERAETPENTVKSWRW